jgi:hypothetical protein
MEYAVEKGGFLSSKRILNAVSHAVATNEANGKIKTYVSLIRQDRRELCLELFLG